MPRRVQGPTGNCPFPWDSRATRIRPGDRGALEKLCRYVMRPALCLKRLAVREDGFISWSLRKPWQDGTKAFVMTPYEFIARLSALASHPRAHQLTYHGGLAPASPLRDAVVAQRSVPREVPREANASRGAPDASH